MPHARKFMQIGEMSRQTGVSIDAIRFYERQGFFQRLPAAKVDSGCTLLMTFPHCNSFVTCKR